MNTNLVIVLFAPAVALNPALLAAVLVMILLPNPKRLMLGYLAGAYAISIAVSLVMPCDDPGRSSGHVGRYGSSASFVFARRPAVDRAGAKAARWPGGEAARARA